MRASRLPFLLGAIAAAAAVPLRANVVVASAAPPSPTAPATRLYEQLAFNTDGRIISLSRLFKDVEQYPNDGGSAVLLTFTVPGAGTFRFDSFTVQIDALNNVALNDNAWLEIALYRNAEPRDRGFPASEATGITARFNVAGLRARGGDYLTFRLSSPPVLARGAQYGIALRWTTDSVAPDSILDDKLLLRLARTHQLDVAPEEGHKRLPPADLAATTWPPDFGNITSDDPVLVIVGEAFEAGGVSWGGVAGTGENGRWVDTGAWLGWIYVESDWVYSDRIGSWMRFPDPGAGATGWAFLPRTATWPGLDGRAEGWTVAEPLGLVFAWREWAYVVDLDRWVRVAAPGTAEGIWIQPTR